MKKSVLRNFAKFTGKHLCQRLFSNEVVGLRPATLLKKSLWHSWCFSVNTAKFLKTSFLTSDGCFCHELLYLDRICKKFHMIATSHLQTNSFLHVK